MTQAAKVARDFHEALEHMLPIFGLDPKPWDDLPRKERAALVATFSYLLDQHMIEGPRRVGRRRRELATPGAVRVDIDAIATKGKDGKLFGLLVGLAELYARAHDDVLAGGGAGELGAGRGSLHGVNPTQDQALDGARAWRRHEIRTAAEAILEARNRIYTARETLVAMAPPKGFRQPDKPGNDNVGLDEDEYKASIEKQEQRAAAGEV